MAKTKKEDTSEEFDADKFSDEMIEKMNSMFDAKIVHNLAKDSDPATIKKWYSTKSKLLDWVISGRKQGGFPGGRVCEISGVESIGKSHIAYQVARWTQENGGINCYEDTELASSIENLKNLGINVGKRFQYSKPKSIEETFRIAEAFLKLALPVPKSKRPPLCIVWDSLGGMGSEYEQGLDFSDPLRPGANAKQIAFGLRKIRNSLNETDATFIVINQVYDIINAGMYEKKTQSKGGRGLKYDCAVRVELAACGHVYPDDMERQEAIAKGLNSIGIKVRATTVKNKVASPFRTIEFEIHYGVGIKEYNQIWELLCKANEVDLGNGMLFKIISNGAWKNFGLYDKTNGVEVMTSGSFRKKELEHKLTIEHKKIIDDAIDVVMAHKMSKDNEEENSSIDPALLEVEGESSSDLIDDLL